MTPLSVVIGDAVVNFRPRFGQAGKAAAVEQLGFEAAPKRFGVGVIAAVAAPAPALRGSVAGPQGLAVGGRILASLAGMNHGPGWGAAHGQGLAQRPADQALGHGRAHVPTDDLARAAVKPRGQVAPAALAGQIRAVAHPDLVGGKGGRLAQQAGGRARSGPGRWCAAQTREAAGPASRERPARGARTNGPPDSPRRALRPAAGAYRSAGRAGQTPAATPARGVCVRCCHA